MCQKGIDLEMQMEWVEERKFREKKRRRFNNPGGKKTRCYNSWSNIGLCSRWN